MENAALENKRTWTCADGLLSNGFILEGRAVYSLEDSLRKEMTGKIEAGGKATAFYASPCGKVFKAAFSSGQIFLAEKKNGYAWECVGEMEEKVIGTFFNQTSGSILIFTEEAVILLDKYFDLIRKYDYKPEVRSHLEKNPDGKISAEWLPDGKYILVCMGEVLSVFAYNLEFISDTLIVCNKIMNSRLMQTKKFLMNESAYVDSVKRVSVPDDTCKAVEDTLQKDSVVFEDRSEYKLAVWHNLFSLIYAVTTDNRIHVLERNGLKYKEIYSRRECDAEEENNTQNEITHIRSQNDYLCTINKEKEGYYLKVYYIKNNTIYLKINQSVSEMCGEPVAHIKDITVSPEYTVRIVTQNKIVEAQMTFCVNRTGRSVIDIDGARVIMYDLAQCCIPPPMYSRQMKLEGVPTGLRSFTDGSITYTVNGKCLTKSLDRKESSTSEERLLKMRIKKERETTTTTELFGIEEGVRMDIGKTSAHISLKGSELHIRTEKAEKKMDSVTSLIQVRTDTGCIVISIGTQAWTELYRVGEDANTGEIVQERVGRTGKSSKIVFATEIGIVMIDRYGMLETFYLGFMLEHKMKKLVDSRDIRRAVTLVKKHGMCIGGVLEPILEEMQKDRIEPEVLLEIVKILLNEKGKELGVEEIEAYTRGKIESTDENTGGSRSAFSWCAILAEIYLCRGEPDLITEILEKFTPKRKISPSTFIYSREYEVPKKIIEKCTRTLSADVLLRCAMGRYAYTLCYLILLCTDTPQDVTNDVLLVDGAESINEEDVEEEIERRLKIARVLKDKKKQTVYLIKRYVKNLKNGKSEENGIENLKKEIESEYIRDYYRYLLEMDTKQDKDWVFGGKQEDLARVLSELLIVTGHSMHREGDHEDALQCYLRGGTEGKEKVRELRMKLGKWKELFADREMQTEKNLAKMEEILLKKGDKKEAAMLNIEYRSLCRGILYLVEIEEFDTLLEIVEKRNLQDERPHIVYIIQILTEKIKAYINSTKNITETYRTNGERLSSVRERKNRERVEIEEGIYADDDCATIQTRSFITNSFLTGNQSMHSKKKKRSSKLRNTVGGRYEEEYVQYVLSELILKAQAQTVSVAKILHIVETVLDKSKTSPEEEPQVKAALEKLQNEKDLYSKELHEFVCVYIRTKQTDFISLNTEEDPLYDPERPVIPEPDDKDIIEYLKKSEHPTFK